MLGTGVFGSGGDDSARRRIYEAFAELGLAGLAERAWEAIKKGASLDAVMIDIRSTPEHKARFPAYHALAAAGNAVSEADILEYEFRGKQLMARYGMPASFSTSAQLQKAMANFKSLDELQGLLQLGQERVLTAPPVVRQAYRQLYGTEGDAVMASLALDFDLSMPELERRVTKAETLGYGMEAGFDFGAEDLENFANLTTQAGAARQVISKLDEQRSLFTESITEAEDLRAEREGVNAALSSGTAASEIERRRQRRIAAGSGKVGAGVTEGGSIGYGPTRR